jgi:hypothetical protein
MGDFLTLVLVLYDGGDFVKNEYHKLEYISGQMDIWGKNQFD